MLLATIGQRGPKPTPRGNDMARRACIVKIDRAENRVIVDRHAKYVTEQRTVAAARIEKRTADLIPMNTSLTGTKKRA